MDAKDQAVLEDSLRTCGIDLAFHQLRAFMDFKNFVALELARAKANPTWAQNVMISRLMNDKEMARLQSDCRSWIEIHEEGLIAEETANTKATKGEGPSIWERMGEPGGCVGINCRCEGDVELKIQHEAFNQLRREARK